MIIKSEKDIVQAYLEDQSGLSGGNALKVYIPEIEEEVSALLSEMSKSKTPITVSGLGTGVTGGRIPFGGTVLSLERLDKILNLKNVSENEASVTVQAGIRVNELKNKLNKSGWLYPPDPTEQNSCIGGNIATNASGSRGFKYGSTRQYITGLKVALSNGETINIKRGENIATKQGKIVIPLKSAKKEIKLPDYALPDIKNAAGYYNLPGMDLVDLFIGSEGTLGVILEAELKLKTRIGKIFGGVAFFSDMQSSWLFAGEARKKSLKARKLRNKDEIDALSLEYLDNNALKLLKGDYPQMPNLCKAAIMFEQDISACDEEIITDKWIKLLEKYGVELENVWLGASVKAQEMFREFRHLLPEKVNEIVRKNKFPKTGTDMAVPEKYLEDLLKYFYKTAENSNIDYLVFGHIGDCHLHANFLPKNNDEFTECKNLYKEIVGKAIDLNGTVSAEHGIGKLKHVYLEQMVGKEGLMQMANLKKALDPALILGIGNILPEELLKKV